MKDSTLVKQLQLGNVKAFETLYRLHYNILCLYANKLVGDANLAENLVSDVIYNIWLKRETLEITSSLRNYLIQAVKNRCYNHLKQEQRRREILQEYYNPTGNNTEASIFDENDCPLTELLAKELDIRLKESINNLPTTTRKVFKLSRFSELKYSEIAHETGLSVDSIKYHIKSALSKLRQELFGNGDV